MFCEKGDYIIVENYTFSSALETAIPLGINFLSIGMDDEGLIPEELDESLSTWDESERGVRKPFLLYMVPTGQNPTGATQSLQRRRAIYEVAKRQDLFIVEDEPYYYLQFPPFASSKTETKTQTQADQHQIPELIPSYLSIDTEGRVLRLDSMSKILAPGSRLGWVTASKQVIEKFIRQNESSSQHPSGFSQAIIYKLVNDQWGHFGFLQWLGKICFEYNMRRDIFARACEEFLPRDIVSWIPAQAGMFVSSENFC